MTKLPDQLFDITALAESAPEDAAPRKKSTRRRKTEAGAAPEGAEPEAEATPAPRASQYILKEIGRIDDEVCSSCDGSLWDILDAHRGEWRVQCVFCGLMLWRPEIKGHLAEVRPEFRFRDGRLAGMTVSEAAATPRGIDTMKIYAKTHADQQVREACQTFLDAGGIAG